MGTMKRADFYKELQEGLNTVFGKEYRRYPELWRGMFETETSNKAFEEEVLSIDFGLAPEKGEGAAVSYDAGGDAWTARYRHTTYALAFRITEEAEEDGLYGSLGARYSKALAQSMQETKEVNCAAIYNNAFSASFPGGDGVALLSTLHPLYGGGTLSNKLSVASDLSEAALEDALNQIAEFTDDRGKFINVTAQKLIVPTELRFVAARLLDSPFRPGTGDNDINALKSMGMLPGGTMATPYLTDPDAWFIRTNAPDGLKHFVRKKIARGMEGEFETGDLRYKARERYSNGWTNWRGLFGSEG
jgi:hypothetical protein